MAFALPQHDGQVAVADEEVDWQGHEEMSEHDDCNSPYREDSDTQPQEASPTSPAPPASPASPVSALPWAPRAAVLSGPLAAAVLSVPLAALLQQSNSLAAKFHAAALANSDSAPLAKRPRCEESAMTNEANEPAAQDVMGEAYEKMGAKWAQEDAELQRETDEVEWRVSNASSAALLSVEEKYSGLEEAQRNFFAEQQRESDERQICALDDAEARQRLALEAKFDKDRTRLRHRLEGETAIREERKTKKLADLRVKRQAEERRVAAQLEKALAIALKKQAKRSNAATLARTAEAENLFRQFKS